MTAVCLELCRLNMAHMPNVPFMLSYVYCLVDQIRKVTSKHSGVERSRNHSEVGTTTGEEEDDCDVLLDVFAVPEQERQK